ncbi:hypothetical protein NUACC26_100270 [Scytonema sp. NUACC26]
MAAKLSKKIAGAILSSVVFITIALTQNSVRSQRYR